MNLYRAQAKQIIIRTAIIFVLTLTLFSKGEASWYGLKPGSHDVGFRTIEKYDYSRSFLPKLNYFGEPVEGERARPIQICLWYPAKTAKDDIRMVYGEYNFPYPEDDRMFNILARMQGVDNGYLYYSFQNDGGVVLDFLSVEMNAVKDASPAEGKFPLIFYFSNLRSGIGDNALLCEYLASHGFVIASSPSLGTHDAAGNANQGDLESLLSDKEFIFANIRDLPSIDFSKIGSLGSGFGGLAAMLLPMRLSDIDAAFSLNNPFIVSDYVDFSRNCPYFNDLNFKVPFMNIYTNDNGETNLALLDTLRYSERFLLSLPETPRTGLTSYRLLSTTMPGREEAVPEPEKQSYRYICEYTYNFFNAFLNKSEKSTEFVHNQPEKNKFDPKLITMSYTAANEVPPNPTEFVQIIRVQGAAEAMKIYEKFKVEQPDLVLFDEATLNAMGYGLLTNGDVDGALMLFKMNSEKFPLSCNVWDSYADGLTAAGETEKAADCLRKAMEAMPADNANETLKEAIRAHARQVLGDEEYAKYEQQ